MGSTGHVLPILPCIVWEWTFRCAVAESASDLVTVQYCTLNVVCLVSRLCALSMRPPSSAHVIESGRSYSSLVLFHNTNRLLAVVL